jgi:hypothetical protein
MKVEYEGGIPVWGGQAKFETYHWEKKYVQEVYLLEF